MMHSGTLVRRQCILVVYLCLPASVTGLHMINGRGPYQQRTSPVLTQQAEQLHKIARAAIKNGLMEDARLCYTEAARRCEAGRASLLLALHLQRMGDVEGARKAFSTGVKRDFTNAQLIQAWALFESKHGPPSRALKLVRRAVQLDSSLSAVLRWRMFRTAAPARGFNSTRARGSDAEMLVQARLAAERPEVVYAYPQAPRGWRGRAELGEDPRLWYDEHGVRNGPPMNYWRQSMDERAHRFDMEAVDALLRGADVAQEADGLRGRMHVRSPQRNQKLLGSWVPIVAEGTLVAEASGERVLVPGSVRLRRGEAAAAEGHLSVGAAVMVEYLDEEGRGVAQREVRVPESAAAPCSARLLARPEAPSEEAPSEDRRVLYLSRYLLLSCAEGDNPAYDLWMRIADKQ